MKLRLVTDVILASETLPFVQIIIFFQSYRGVVFSLVIGHYHRKNMNPTISRYIDVKEPIGSKLLFLRALSAPEKEPIS